MDRFPKLIEPKYAAILTAILFATTVLIVGIRKRRKYVRVGKVNRLFIWPIKGCKGKLFTSQKLVICKCEFLII